MGDCISWCNPVFKRVEELPDLDYATRNHAYIMPDDKAYILNEDGNGFIELATTATTVGTTYDDKPIVARVEKLEAKEDTDKQTLSINNRTISISNGNSIELPADKDTVYDDSDIKRRITALENKPDNDKQTLAIDGSTLSISNGNSVEIPNGAIYKAGNGITITEDGTINNSVVDTNTKYSLNYNVTGTTTSLNLSSLNPQPSDYPLAPNTFSATGIDYKNVKSASYIMIEFPEIIFTVSGIGFGKYEETLSNPRITVPVCFIDSSTILGYGTLTTPFGNLNVSFEVNLDRDSYFAFSFDFFKLDVKDGENVSSEPMLTVPMSIDNLTQGTIFGANFADEFINKVKVVDEPTILIRQLYYTLEEVTN